MNPSSSPDQPTQKNQPSFTMFLIPLAFVLGICAGYFIWGRPGAVAAPSAAAQPPAASQAAANSAQTTPQKIKRYDVPVDDDPSLGPANAPITIIEFSDYQCPYCQRWYEEVMKPLMQAFPNQIRFVYRDFPLSFHPEAQPAAEAANCAGEQGKYFPFHDLVFAGGQELSSATFQKYASDLGLNMDKFNQCVSARKYQGEVQADFDFAANMGVQSTPTFFINGLAVVGAQPLDVFQQIVQKELNGEIPK